MRIILSFCLALTPKNERAQDDKTGSINEKIELTRSEILSNISNNTEYFTISYTLPLDNTATTIEGMYYEDATRISCRYNEKLIRNRSHKGLILICFNVEHCVFQSMPEYHDFKEAGSVDVDLKLGRNGISNAFLQKPFQFIEEQQLQKSHFSEIYESGQEEPVMVRLDDIGDDFEPPLWTEEIIDEFINIAVLYKEKGGRYKITTFGKYILHFVIENNFTKVDSLEKKMRTSIMLTIEKKMGELVDKYHSMQGKKSRTSIEIPSKSRLSSSAMAGTSQNVTLKLNCEDFFIDQIKKFDRVVKDTEPGIRYFNTTIDVKTPFTGEEKEVLNPLIFKLFKMCNIPKDKLRSKGITEMYASYTLFDYPTVTTPPQNVETEMVFDDYRTFFTDVIENPEKIINFFQREYLRIDFYGTKTVKEFNKIALFSEELMDARIAKPMEIGEAKKYLETAKQPLPMDYPICHVNVDFGDLLHGAPQIDRKQTPVRSPQQEVIILEAHDLAEANTFIHYRCDFNILPVWNKFVLPNEEYLNLLLFVTTLKDVEIIEDVNVQVHNWNAKIDAHDVERLGMAGCTLITDEFALLFLEGLNYQIAGFHKLIKYRKCLCNKTEETGEYSKLIYDPLMLSKTRFYVDTTAAGKSLKPNYHNIFMKKGYMDVIQTGFIYNKIKLPIDTTILNIDMLCRCVTMTEICQQKLLPSAEVIHQLQRHTNSLLDIHSNA